MSLYAGYDPGSNGAVVVVDREQRIVGSKHVNADYNELVDALSLMLTGVTHLTIESVPVIPGQLMAQRQLSTLVGVAYGVAAMHKVAVQLVSPQAWQKKLGVAKTQVPWEGSKDTKEYRRHTRMRYEAHKRAVAAAVYTALGDGKKVLAETRGQKLADAAGLALYSLWEAHPGA